MPDAQRASAAWIQHPATLCGVFLISLSLILTELLLTRIFSVLFMYHFAFLVISLALFGMGVGGIAVYLAPQRFAGDPQRRVVSLVLWFVAALLGLVFFLFNVPLVPSASLRGTLSTAVVYVVASLPFFFGGTCLSLILSRAGQQVSRVYFVDLLGAGMGCLLIVPTLNNLGGVTALLAAGGLAAASALMFALPERRIGMGPSEPRSILPRTLLGISIALAVATVAILVIEPLAAWIGAKLFAGSATYSNRAHPFEHYFATQIQPEIQRVVTATRIPLLLAFVAAITGWLFVRRWQADSSRGAVLVRNDLRLAAGVTLVAIIGLLVLNASTDAIRVRFAKGRVEFQNLFEGWNSFSRIVVQPRRGTSKSVYAWGLSPLYQGPPGEQLALDIDSLAGTPLAKFDGNLDAPGLEHLSHDITALAYVLRPAQRTLIIGAGGGRDVLTAMKFGSKEITAVELNPIIVDVVNEKFGDFTGKLYTRPEVNLVIGDGRHFVRSSDATFDVIQLSLVDTWASTAAGAFSLSENSLYTTEAFVDYLNRLKPDGVLAVSRWLLTPPRETLRVVSLAREALQRLGVTDVTRHVMVAGTPPLRRGHRFASVVIGKRPFTDAEVAAARDFIQRLGFQVLYLPGDPADPIFSDLITASDADGFFDRYRYDVRPSTDNHPFFFNTAKPSEFLRLWESSDGRMGVHLLARLGVVVLILVALFMIVPLYVRRRSVLAALEPGARWATLLYFGALGSGFMLVEVCLISKFVLFLGHPTYALTVVLCSMLISAGLGSAWSGRNVTVTHVALRRVIIAALIAIGALALALEWLLPPLLTGASRPLAIVMTVILLAPVGFLMGMPFPLGLRLLDHAGPQWAELIPWVWGINGAASVLGSVMAISIAINFGFQATLLAGVGVYLIACLTATRLAGGAVVAATAEAARSRRAAVA